MLRAEVPPGDVSECVTRYLRPEPRLRAGILIGRNRAATSCIDLSDGLADAVWQIAEASGVGITVDETALPVTDEVRSWHGRRGSDFLPTVLAGGDDYELLVTCRARDRRRLDGVRRQIGDLPITRIGVVTKGPNVLIRDEHGATREMPRGYEHFRSSTVGDPNQVR
jgi:thiamine-monophosphate kinase